MLTQKTALDQIEITLFDAIQLRFGLHALKDGVPRSEPRWHRTAIMPGVDVDTQLKAVSDNLVLIGEEPISAADVARVKSYAAIAHTSESIALTTAIARANQHLEMQPDVDAEPAHLTLPEETDMIFRAEQIKSVSASEATQYGYKLARKFNEHWVANKGIESRRLSVPDNPAMTKARRQMVQKVLQALIASKYA